MRLPDTWSKAPLTAVLTIATVGAWLLAALFQQEYWAADMFGFWPANPAPGPVPVWLQPLTATLVHAGLGHLLFNIIVLVFCGRPVESVLGTPALAVLYVLGAYAAAGAQYLANPLAIAPMIGASGAISAVLGAYAMLFGRNKVKVSSPTLALWLNALWLMAAWVVLQICLGVALSGATFVTGGEGVTIAVAAHIGGFAVGLLLANPLLLFKYRKA
ncbi:MAG TPA: rhomboid family intramembrane serine protease [Allosphingosinicella sp.]|nr:rhomboid family intramembrane serine protease [Allosphingosinicella sp.]